MGDTNHTIPYGRQCIDHCDIDAVVAALQSGWLTTGPAVDRFERAFAEFCGTSQAVAVCNGTAALHCAVHAAGVGPGDEVIVPPMTFAATANAVLYCGAKPVFADVEEQTLLLDPSQVERKLSSRAKAIIAVDYAGQPCDYDALRAIADEHGLVLIADACHAVGGTYKARPVGSVADMSAFSFHPVKNMTSGEGGMITTDNDAFAQRMRSFRNHGITADHRQRQAAGSWFYEMSELGFNYRITDFQSALGVTQLERLPSWISRRREIAVRYDAAFARSAGIEPLGLRADVRAASADRDAGNGDAAQGSRHAYHLYVVRMAGDRGRVFGRLRQAGIGANVHYIPVHLHPYYRDRLGTGPGDCPVAEAAYEQILSLPMFPGLSDDQVDRVIRTTLDAVAAERSPSRSIPGGIRGAAA